MDSAGIKGAAFVFSVDSANCFVSTGGGMKGEAAQLQRDPISSETCKTRLTQVLLRGKDGGGCKGGLLIIFYLERDWSIASSVIVFDVFRILASYSFSWTSKFPVSYGCVWRWIDRCLVSEFYIYLENVACLTDIVIYSHVQEFFNIVKNIYSEYFHWRPVLMTGAC